MDSEKKTLILIVDDEQFTRVIFQDALEKAGFMTALAGDGASAIASFLQLQPDMVLLDLIMPDKDGFQTCQEIRNLQEGKYTPVLMVTGLGDTESINRAFESGATDFITKPINTDLLVHRVRYMLRASQNITEMKQVAERLVMLKEAVDCLPIGITISDVTNRIIYANPAEAEMHGYLLDELIDNDVKLFAELNLDKAFHPEIISNSGVWRRESTNIRKNGEEFPAQLSSLVIKNSEERCLGMVTVCEDITSRKTAEERIQRLAYSDSLTGLPNRAAFLECLQHALSFAHREDRKVGLLFLDLDNFKDVNDTQGHDFGDRLLKEVAERLASDMRESDTLARLGGDEFVLALSSLTDQESAAIAAQRLLTLFSRPFIMECRQIYSSASIGIAIYPDDGIDAETLFKCADTAMYHAKTEGKSNYRFFSTEMNQRIMRRVSLESSLRQGMENQEFFLHYQPQWDLKGNRMLGVEALLRWQSAEFGSMMPTEFIPLAENSGQIIGLGEWAMRAACIQAREWAMAGYGDLKMAVNISGLQFRQPDFLEMIGKIIEETGIEPEALELEFTESVVMERAEKNIDTLRSLKKLGVRLSIDDFGTGYSSLSYLKHFPIDRIKIDRSFVADLDRNSDGEAIVEAIISLAHSLNLKVVAEGVETVNQLRFLEARNCDEVQGFHLAIPMLPENLVGNMAWPFRVGSVERPVLYS
jgi:diguanylate cyclase (GGDEF)-like protein/PAS domain S-box-containing protein